MESKHYKLRFLPLFAEDLGEIVDYISNKLQSPAAAAGESVNQCVICAVEERMNRAHQK